jgi:tetratricopeptide (TPR) repeat protein
MNPTEMQLQVDRAVDLEREGKHDEAIALLDTVLAIDPRFPRARQNRGNNFFKKHHLDEAISDYTLSTELLPGERAAWYNLGVACLQKGDKVGGVAMLTTSGARAVSSNDVWYQRAISAFTRALEIEPTYTPALVMRAHTHANRLDEPRARADFIAADKLGDPVAMQALQRRLGAQKS